MARTAGTVVPVPRRASAEATELRAGASFGAALAASHVAQLAWVFALSRTLAPGDLGRLLTAQALYAVLQVAIDNGPMMHGARMAAAGGLGAGDRGALVRARLLLCLPALATGVLIAVLGGERMALALAPYGAALVLFALLNVWEPYGRGHAAPWATYLGLRALAPAAAAMIVLASDAAFPLALAGAIECGVILGVGLAYAGFAGVRSLRAAGPVPWGAISRIGTGALVQQASLASGPVMLTATGHPARAGVLAACLRLLTGLNGLTGLFSTALYPRLARGRDADRERAFAVAAPATVALVASALAVTIAVPEMLLEVLLDRADGVAARALVLVVATAAAGGVILLLTAQLVARGDETAVMRAGFAALGVTLLLAGGALATASAAVLELVAGGLLAGQSTMALMLARRQPIDRPSLAGAIGLCAVGAISAAIDPHPLLALPAAAIAVWAAARAARALR